MCTATTYKTDDFYVGRTLDYEFSYGEVVAITPRNYPINFHFMDEAKNHYAMIGMAHIANDYPLYYGAVWNGSICFYYIFLVIIRGIIINSERKYRGKADKRFRNKVHLSTSIILLFMNVSLVAPIILMVQNKKEVTMGMIPAITVALYTTIKVVNASINLKETKKVHNKLVKELRYINFIEALVSILTLQNTLIAVKGESNKSDMILLSTISSIGILIFIIIITLLNFRKRKTTLK